MRRLITLLVLIVFFVNILYAGGGIWAYYLEINSTWYGNQSGNTPLHGALLASDIILNSSTLTIATRGINTWQDGGCDVSSANFNYRIYKQGDTPPSSFTVVNLSYQGQNGNDKFWHNNNPSINILQGITQTGTYVFEVYFDAPTNGNNCAQTLYESNGGGNFHATFIVTGTLPLNLVNFEAELKSSDIVELSWQTNALKNIEYFEIHHSNDGIGFKTIEKIKRSANFEYSFLHKTQSENTHYYRIKQVDFDGSASYSGIRSVDIISDQVYLSPNPGYGLFRISGLDSTPHKVIVRDQTGREVLRTASDTGQEYLDLSSFSQGIYFITVQGELRSETLRAVKL